MNNLNLVGKLEIDCVEIYYPGCVSRARRIFSLSSWDGNVRQVEPTQLVNKRRSAQYQQAKNSPLWYQVQIKLGWIDKKFRQTRWMPTMAFRLEFVIYSLYWRTRLKNHSRVMINLYSSDLVATTNNDVWRMNMLRGRSEDLLWFDIKTRNYFNLDSSNAGNS